MKRLIISIALLILTACGANTNAKNPFLGGNSQSSPILTIRNNHWDVRFVRVYCDDTQIQIIRGLRFNSDENRALINCPTNYRFTVNDQWRSRPILWEGGNIILTIEQNLQLSSLLIFQ